MKKIMNHPIISWRDIWKKRLLIGYHRIWICWVWKTLGKQFRNIKSYPNWIFLHNQLKIERLIIVRYTSAYQFILKYYKENYWIPSSKTLLDFFMFYPCPKNVLIYWYSTTKPTEYFGTFLLLLLFLENFTI